MVKLPKPNFAFSLNFAVALLIVAALYCGREFLIPLALSVLLSFLLAPVVGRLERWKLRRLPAVLITVSLAGMMLALMSYLVAGQVLELAGQLPGYKVNLAGKIIALKPSGNGPLARAARTLKELAADLSSQTPTTSATPGTKTAEGVEPMPVNVVSGPESALTQVFLYGRPALRLLATAALIAIFVVFMLLGREDLRDRLIHLLGRGQLNVTTHALNEAGQRVSRYLAAQLMTNGSYGALVAVGLYFVGVPNPFLWGFLAAVLRFVPYLGAWMGMLFPLVLSLAVSQSWAMPLWTFGLFALLEITTANVVEPFLYGSSTGLAPIAVLVSATFWATVWGTLGLLLSTPLTVCLLVLGRHVPRLSFLEVLLSAQAPIAEADRFYQRLLAHDGEELSEMAEKCVREHSLDHAFASLLLPALCLAEQDLHSGLLNETERHGLLLLARELMADLRADSDPAAELAAPAAISLYCIPVCGEADETGATMLARLLEIRGLQCEVLSAKSMLGELLEEIGQSTAHLICLVAISPGSARQAVLYLKRLRERFPERRVVVGLWGEQFRKERQLERLAAAKPDAVVTTLEAAVREIAASLETAPLPISTVIAA